MLDRTQPRGVLAGRDMDVWLWACREYNLFQHQINKAYGIIENGILVGAAVFHNYNSINVEFSFYGQGQMTAGLVRYFTCIGLDTFHAERCTIHCRRSHKKLVRFLLKIGAKHEGTLWNFYGRDNKSRNAACQFVLTRDVAERLVRRR